MRTDVQVPGVHPGETPQAPEDHALVLALEEARAREHLRLTPFRDRPGDLRLSDLETLLPMFQQLRRTTAHLAEVSPELARLAEATGRVGLTPANHPVLVVPDPSTPEHFWLFCSELRGDRDREPRLLCALRSKAGTRTAEVWKPFEFDGTSVWKLFTGLWMLEKEAIPVPPFLTLLPFQAGAPARLLRIESEVRRRELVVVVSAFVLFLAGLAGAGVALSGVALTPLSVLVLGFCCALLWLLTERASSWSQAQVVRRSFEWLRHGRSPEGATDTGLNRTLPDGLPKTF